MLYSVLSGEMGIEGDDAQQNLCLLNFIYNMDQYLNQPITSGHIQIEAKGFNHAVIMYVCMYIFNKPFR